MTRERIVAFLLLVLATALWGFGFIATKWALVDFSVNLLLFLRFFIGGVLGVILWKLLPMKSASENFKSHMLISFWPGIWLALMLLFQTWGLKTSTASQSAFITVLYVVLVPVIELLLYKKNFH